MACTWTTDDVSAAGVCAEIVANSGSAIAVHLDCADPASTARAVASAVDELGPIDILVNSAAIRPFADIEEVTIDEWDAVLDTNLRGPFLLSREVIPAMRSRGFGRIIMIGGLVAGYWGGTGPHVGASKLGLVGLSRQLALQTATQGITVNVVVPGAIASPERTGDTPDVYHGMTAAQFEQMKLDVAAATVPMRRVGGPDDIASACVFLASNDAGYITGQELFVTGGAHPLGPLPLAARSSG